MTGTSQAKTAQDADKAAGKHIPAAPTEAPPAAEAEATVGQAAGEPTYSFEPAGGDVTEAAGPATEAAAEWGGALNEALADGTDSPDIIWTDEQTALGRRIAVTRRPAGEGESVTAYEEVLAHGSTETQVAEAKRRLSSRVEVQA